MNSLQSFWHATGVFSDRLTDVRLGSLALALAFILSNLLLRSTAWRNILAAAHPGVRVRWRSITGAYLAGAGVNAIVPARGGDVTKIYLAHRSIPGSAYTTVTSSLIAETLIDLLIGPLLLMAAYSTGRLPHLPAIGQLPAFEWSFMEAHGRVFVLLLAAILITAGVFFTYIEHHVNSFWSRIADGVAILRTPRAVSHPSCVAAAGGLVLSCDGHVLLPAGLPDPGLGSGRPAGPERRQCRHAAAADARRHRSAAGAAGLHVPGRSAGVGGAVVQRRHAVLDHAR